MKSSYLTAGVIACVVIFGSFEKRQDPLAASIERGRKVYQLTCLPCHQSKGSGVPGMNPPLTKTKYVLGEKDTLINIVLNGFDQEVEINGQVYSNPMPAQPQLKNEEIADVLTFVRNSFGNKATAVMPDDVKKWRPK